MFGKKQQEEKIGPSKGVMKWLNKFFRFLFYPFIHPKAFLLLLLVVVAAVLVPWQVYKVELADIPQWYGKIFNVGYKKTSDWVAPLKDKVVEKYNNITDNKTVETENVQDKNAEDIVDYQLQPQTQRPTFSDETNVVEEEISVVDVDENSVILPQPQVAETTDAKEDTTEQSNGEALSDDEVSAEDVHYKRDENSGLSYLDVPRKINGRFTVIKTNDILVGSNEVFLYGINVITAKNSETLDYLMKNFDGRKITCYIVAYNSQRKEAAICFQGKLDINRDLIERGYAENNNLY